MPDIQPLSQSIGKSSKQTFQDDTTELQEGQEKPEKTQVVTPFSKNSSQLLKPANILSLQRTIGNRAVSRLISSHKLYHSSSKPLPATLPAVQRTPQQNAQILANVPATAPNPNYEHEGSKGDSIKNATEDFITGDSGTWHHIYPRNLLGRHIRSISKYFVATNGNEAQLTTTANSSHKDMLTLASSLPIDKTGSLAKPARYYWKTGNGFAGVRSDYRTDDPGSLVEHGKPPQMSKDKYQLPRDWGKELEKLSNTLEGLAGTTAENLPTVDASISKLAQNIITFSQKLDDADPHRTVSAVEGKDWERKDKAGDKAWGAKIKNYKMVAK